MIKREIKKWKKGGEARYDEREMRKREKKTEIRYVHVSRIAKIDEVCKSIG